ncbi:NAD(P)/FAD-dependent oxidoreductase [Solirubrobacter soli]|uniref:NAD(P)/FAD-dependent oxidoreductase n=1 Tax=Solirubrobacter soli TaxID=363832 RepID=UPI000487DEED|nr:FAD-binding oxidoreductase [Solirubrobacter soli]
MRVAVVGAGICGLAAGFELQRRGARVTVYESVGVGAGQSLGLARIFRIAHASPLLCELALEARAGWRAWEREFGVRLLGAEGLVVVGDEAAAGAAGEPGGSRGDAMRAAGAPVEAVDDARARLPFFGYDWGDGIFDPLAGSLRIRRALDALASRVSVEPRTVTDVDALEADAVLVCAGIGTHALVPELDFQLTYEPHIRITYELGTSAPCVISPELYGCPLGSTGRYAIGMHDQGRHAAVSLPAVGRVECVSPHAPWLDAHGDGFLALRRGRVTAFTGSNLMKFGPLIGDRLAVSVLSGEIHADLRSRAD